MAKKGNSILIVPAVVFVVSLVLSVAIISEVMPDAVLGDSFGEWIPMIVGSFVALAISSLSRFIIRRSRRGK